MKLAHHFFKLMLAFSATLAFVLPANAQTQGKDYELVSPPQTTENPAKIEVIEFFSYACSHCAELNPMISDWAAKLPQDVVFRKIPVTFERSSWVSLAKLHYTLEATGDLARLENDIFRAIHSERANLFNERAATEWVSKKNVNAKKFSEMYNSFGIVSKVKRAEQMTVAYRVEGVPSLFVNGKYLVGGSNFKEMLNNADRLINKERAAKKK